MIETTYGIQNYKHTRLLQLIIMHFKESNINVLSNKFTNFMLHKFSYYFESEKYYFPSHIYSYQSYIYSFVCFSLCSFYFLWFVLWHYCRFIFVASSEMILYSRRVKFVVVIVIKWYNKCWTYITLSRSKRRFKMTYMRSQNYIHILYMMEKMCKNCGRKITKNIYNFVGGVWHHLFDKLDQLVVLEYFIVYGCDLFRK